MSVLLMLCVGLPRTSLAQHVRGTVDASGGGRPSGAVVVLVDEQGLFVARTLARADGSFTLTAQAPGRYRLRAIRLGFRPSAWDTVTVGPAGVDGIRITMASVPVRLAAVAVSAERQCTTRPDSSTVAFGLWQAAQAALLGSSVAQQDSRLALTITTFQRAVNTTTGQLLRLRQETRPGNTTRPFAATLTAAEFAQRGFVEQEQDGGTFYRAPDADVLLSPTFLDSHCFSLTAPDSGHAGGIGLSFEPNREQRDVSDVRGSLWLDRRTSELRTLEWSYTNIEPAAAAAGAGGRLTFGQLPSGIWVVKDWVLRMPVVSEQRSTTASSGVTTLGTLRVRQHAERVVRTVEEVGGVVVSVRDAEKEIWSTHGEQRKVRLVDAETRGPLVGAQVELRGTSQHAVSDSGGYTSFPYVLDGRYELLVVRPSLAKAGVAYEAGILVQRARVEPSEIEVPGDPAVLRIACADQYTGLDRAVVSGTIVANDGSAPAHAVRVRATSRGDMQGIGSRGAATTVRAVWTRTDELGRYYLCGLPWDEEVIIQAPDENGQPGHRVVLRRAAPTNVDIMLNP
jgi:hypothetical protein